MEKEMERAEVREVIEVTAEGCWVMVLFCSPFFLDYYGLIMSDQLA